MDFAPDFQTWSTGTFLFEHYRFAPGPITPLNAHAHEAIQVCLNSGSGGQYRYRGAYQSFAPNSLTVINSGEVHAPGLRGNFAVPTAFRMTYIDPAHLHQLARDLQDGPVDEPYFPTLIQSARSPAGRLLALAHQALEAQPATLTTDVWLLLFQVALLTHHTDHRPSPRLLPDDQPALHRVREYLHDRLAARITLRELADIACLSEYHFCRSFRKRFGLAPHQYLTQLRVDTAKRLLLAGTPVSEVARQTGFFDNSHLLRHFRRIVGVLPSQFVK